LCVQGIGQRRSSRRRAVANSSAAPSGVSSSCACSSVFYERFFALCAWPSGSCTSLRAPPPEVSVEVFFALWTSARPLAWPGGRRSGHLVIGIWLMTGNAFSARISTSISKAWIMGQRRPLPLPGSDDRP
jgi:hypothetical protein